jgi:hypothetical protein
MKSSILVAIVAFAAGCAGSAMLWQFWTPRCNEACPEWIALSMLGFVAIFPFACAGTGAAVTAKRYAIWVRWALFAFFVVSTSAIISVLTYSTR